MNVLHINNNKPLKTETENIAVKFLEQDALQWFH